MDRLAASVRSLADAAARGPSLAELPLFQAREAVAAMSGQFGQGDPIAAVDDVHLPATEGDLTLRIYQPQIKELPSVLLWLHGGGWSTGDLQTGDALCRRLSARLNMTVAALDYRLAPEHPFPAALEDIDTAARWLADPANGITDGSGICLGGDSAGGNLAAAYAMNRPAVSVIAQLLAFPAVDLRGGYASETEFASGFFTTLNELHTWIGHYLAGQDAEDPRVSPILAIGTGSPPALVLTAECDPLRDAAEEFATRMRQEGALVRSHRFPGMVHDFVLFGDLLPEAGPATEMICREFGALLHEATTGSPL